MANETIRTYAKEKGVKLWMIADALNLNDGNFSRKLRKELSTEEKAEIISIINDLSRA